MELKKLKKVIFRIYRQEGFRRAMMVAISLVTLPVLVWGAMLATRWLSRATEPTVQLTFSPNSGTLPPDKSLAIVIEAGLEKISGAHIEFTFDPTHVQLAEEVQIVGALTQVFVKTTVAEANATGRVKLAVGLPLGQAGYGPSGNIEIARVTFRAAITANPAASVNFDENKVEIVNDSARILRVSLRGATLATNLASGSGNEADTSPTSTPPPEAEATPGAQLAFKIRLQGISTMANPQTARLMFVDTQTNLSLSEQIPLTAQADGTYGGVATNIFAGTYNVFVKSGSHLQRRVATNLTLIPGQTLTKNWTGSQQQLLVGDVNNTNTITIEDAALVLSRYTDLAVSVPLMTREDVNADGKITVDDINLVLLNYSDFTINGDQ